MQFGPIAAKFCIDAISWISLLHACQGRLALTAPSGRHSEDASDGRLEQVCQTAIAGRRAARELAQRAGHFGLSESELQILWGLCGVLGPGVDQTTLATQLALSPPQVSACVEKLRTRGLIVNHEARGDRRRRVWQSSAIGWDLLQAIAKAAGESREAAA
jgi:DNA-binding MarR family transcriptional regulator